jgi:hypothetical protein
MKCKEGMSNPAQDEPPGPLEPPAAVFARLSDVPLDVLDKLIETTEGGYADLNQVRGHPYWGGLVLHQGAALRALREARECLDALRGEAVGARNTELGVTVATAVVDGERHYAETGDGKAKLVERVLRPRDPATACHFYVWDRPYEDDQVPGPYTQIRIVTDRDTEVGVLNFTEESEDGELCSWHTCNPRPLADGPTLRFDAGSPLTFPRDSLLPFADLRHALLAFGQDGLRPDRVSWQQARWEQP